MVLIYDGSEGGQHYTWEYFHVLGLASHGPTRADSDDGLDPLAVVVALAGVAVGLLGLVAAGFYRRKLRQARSR
jgi:hypothetical protein